LSQVEQIESQIAALSSTDLAAFRKWFAAFDASAWDQQFEADVKAGRLDRLTADALRDHAAGQSKEF
jgi:hypothetical protein